MIKSSKLLIFSFLASSISFLHTMQEIEHLSKKTVKDMIIKYQIDNQSIYLASLLALPRETLINDVSESLKQYQEDLKKYRSSETHYAQDLKETEKKHSATNKVLNYIVDNFGENIEPYKVLSVSSNLQKNLMLQYERAIENEKTTNFAYAQNNLDKITFLLEALYLTATQPKHLSENSKLYKRQSLHFHPDKIQDKESEIQEQKSNFFKVLQPLLGSDTGTDHLNNIVKAIHEKRNERIEQINNPSALTYAGHFFCSTALPMIGKGLGAAVYHKTFAQIIPRAENENTPNENILYNICVASARKTALDIETKLVKIPYHP